MVRIPHIIHQTWKNDNLPEAFRPMSRTWREMLPNWEYRLWTDEMCCEFVHCHYPDFLPQYDAYPMNIQRADAIRYFLLQTYGGLYVDLDFECLKPDFVSIIEEAEFVAGKEPYVHARRYNMEYLICNALMASVPNHPFMEYVIRRMKNHPKGWNFQHVEDILSSTGPILLTEAYRDFPQKESLKIVEPQYLYPIWLGEVNLIKRGNMQEGMAHRINAAYALHHFSGTWWQELSSASRQA